MFVECKYAHGIVDCRLTLLGVATLLIPGVVQSFAP